MTKRPKFLLFIAAIFALPLAGSLAAYWIITAYSSLHRGMGYDVVLTLVITLGLLAVPYGMLKLLAHALHTMNPREHIPGMKDLPKDKDESDKAM